MIEHQSYEVLQNHTESSAFLDTRFPANFQLPFWKIKNHLKPKQNPQ